MTLKLSDIVRKVREDGIPGLSQFDGLTGFDLYINCDTFKASSFPVPGRTLYIGYYIFVQPEEMLSDLDEEIKRLKKFEGYYSYNPELISEGKFPLEYFKKE